MLVAVQFHTYYVAAHGFDIESIRADEGEIGQLSLVAADEVLMVRTSTSWGDVEVSLSVLTTPPTDSGATSAWDSRERATLRFSRPITLLTAEFEVVGLPEELTGPPGLYDVLVRARRVESALEIDGDPPHEQHSILVWPRTDGLEVT